MKHATRTMVRDLTAAWLVLLLASVYSPASADEYELQENLAGTGFGLGFPGLAADGDVLVVANFQAGQQRPVYVYRRSGSSWSLEDQLLPAGPSAVGFGSRVAIDGDVIVVGHPSDDVAGVVDAGTVRVYRWNGSTWPEEQVVTATVPLQGQFFGSVVDVDGDVIVVGRNLTQLVTSAYRWDGSTWGHEQDLSIPPGQLLSPPLGSNAVSVDGDTIVLGFETASVSVPQTFEGAVAVFRWSGTTWDFEQMLTPTILGTFSVFGRSVTVDADTAVVSQLIPSTVSIFRRAGSTWSWEQNFAANDGFSQALAGDLLVVGEPDAAPYHPSAQQGAVRLFRRSGSTWSEDPILVATNHLLEDEYGRSVALGDDAIHVAAPSKDLTAPGSNEGVVYIYDATPSDPWLDMGGGAYDGTLFLAGVYPQLSGCGSLVGGTPASLALKRAPPSQLALAWISFTPVPTPALGGVLHAFPFANQLLFATNAAGEFSAGTTWPVGIPSATQVWFQFIVQDPTSPNGLVLSNGLRATSQ